MILEQGALSGNYSSKHMFPLFSMRRLIFGKNKFIKINKLIEHIKNLAEVHSVKTSQIPIAGAIHKGIVPIIGLTKPEYVQALSLNCQSEVRIFRVKNEKHPKFTLTKR